MKTRSKVVRFTALILLLATLAGCRSSIGTARSPDDPFDPSIQDSRSGRLPASPKDPGEAVTVYLPSGGTLVPHVVRLDKVTAAAVFGALQEVGTVNPAIVLESVYTDGGVMRLNLSAALQTELDGLSEQGRQLFLAAIVNTMCEAMGCDSVKLLAGGKTVKSGSLSYLMPLSPVEDPSTVDYYKTETPAKPPLTGKVAALSFDDGPHTVYTRKIADKLEEYGARCTFFIVGDRVNATTAAAMKYAMSKGCEIQIHGYTHSVSYKTCSQETYEYEINETAKVIEEYLGVSPTMMRPFGGAITAERAAACWYPVIIWDVDSEDWRHKNPAGSQEQIDIIVNNVMSTVKDGSIILMHELYENSYQAFCIIIEQLYQQGYQVVSVSDLLGTPQAGVRYYSRSRFK